jgi:hypothetical protein
MSDDKRNASLQALSDEQRAKIEEAIKETEYKYFGDYEFSEEQHAAVDTLVDAACALLSHTAPQAEPCPADMGEHACQNRHQCWEPCGELGHSAEHAKVAGSPVSAPAVSELPPLPDDEAVEQFIYERVRGYVPESMYEPIRQLMHEYAQAALAAQHGYRLVEDDAPVQDGETAKRRWLEYAETEVGDKRLSEMSPSQREDAHEFWLRKQIGWMGSYHIEHYQFLLKRIDELRAQLSTARAEGRQEGIEAAANVCDRHARASWNDDRSTQAKLDTKEIRGLLNKENNDDRI